MTTTPIYSRGCLQPCNTTGKVVNGTLSVGVYCCTTDNCNYSVYNSLSTTTTSAYSSAFSILRKHGSFSFNFISRIIFSLIVGFKVFV